MAWPPCPGRSSMYRNRCSASSHTASFIAGYRRSVGLRHRTGRSDVEASTDLLMTSPTGPIGRPRVERGAGRSMVRERRDAGRRYSMRDVLRSSQAAVLTRLLSNAGGLAVVVAVLAAGRKWR